MDRYLVDGHWLEAARVEARHSNLPTIVMLHEGLGSIAHWKDFPCILAEVTGAGVFVYSRYGHGCSDALKEPRSVSYMHHEAQVVLPDTLRQAKIERPLLLGHSDGASIAILYAGMFPDSPAGLILEAPHVFVEDITVSRISQARSLYNETDLSSCAGISERHPLHQAFHTRNGSVVDLNQLRNHLCTGHEMRRAQGGSVYARIVDHRAPHSGSRSRSRLLLLLLLLLLPKDRVEHVLLNLRLKLTARGVDVGIRTVL